MNFKVKLLGAAVLPVIFISLSFFWIIQTQSQNLAKTQIAEVEAKAMATRRAEIEKMNLLALSSLRGLYDSSTVPEIVAKQQAKALLNKMEYGEDGYFFVYDQHGTNLVHPRLPHLVGKNWWELKDINGDFVIQNLIEVAQAGGGFHSYVWNKPSSGKPAKKLGHAVFLEKWGWMIGTGLYVDDLENEFAALRETLSKSIERTTRTLLIMAAAGVFLAAFITWFIRLSEQRFADKRLKELTHRIVEVQEDERQRVSTELHDGISQLLVSARYGLDQALAKAGKESAAEPVIKKSMSTIESAISEVRRISMDLRPSVLDDIGLAAAISSLTRDFSQQTGIKSDCKVSKVGQRISSKAQTALYRVAQEALTNVAKHSDAKSVKVTLQPEKDHVYLKVEDDGKLKLRQSSDVAALPSQSPNSMGLRNMHERMEAFQGELRVSMARSGGLIVRAELPISDPV